MSVKNITRFLIYANIQHPSVPSNVRYYSRWTHRKPAKVILPFQPNSNPNLKKEKVIDLTAETKPSISQTPSKEKFVQTETIELNSKTTLPNLKSQDIVTKRIEKLKKRKFYLSQKKVFDDENEIIYEKLKENDGRISTLFTNLKSKKDRLRMQQMMVEGWRLIVDGLEAKCQLKYVIFSQHEDLNNIKPFLPKTGVIFYKVTYKEIELWSNVETSPGIIGVFEMPTQQNVKRFSKPLPLQFICDNIRVPGNLGTILRVAIGAGCDRVLLSKGCVDIWEPKVIRSAAGAHFRLPIHTSIDWEEMPKYLEEETSLFIADSNTQELEDNIDEFQSMHIPVVPYYSFDYSALKHVTLIIGGETEGISEDSYRLAGSRNGLRLNIPLHKGVDSLNTGIATAVVAFEIRKQLIQAQAKLRLNRHLAEAT